MTETPKSHPVKWTHFIAFAGCINMYMVLSILNDMTMSFKAHSDINSNYDGSCQRGA